MQVSAMLMVAGSLISKSSLNRMLPGDDDDNNNNNPNTHICCSEMGRRCGGGGGLHFGDECAKHELCGG